MWLNLQTVSNMLFVCWTQKSQQQASLKETRAELFLFLDLTPCTYSTRFGTVLFARLSLKSENVLRLVKKSLVSGDLGEKVRWSRRSAHSWFYLRAIRVFSLEKPYCKLWLLKKAKP